MALRGKLDEIRSAKVAQQEASEKEAQLSEQEQAKQEENNFQDAITRKHTLSEALLATQEARSDTRQALGSRKEEFRNITGLIDEIKDEAEDPAHEVPSFKEAVADSEEGSDEEKYNQSKEDVVEAVAKLRKQKEELKALGVDADGLNDEELVQAVKKVQEDADTTIEEFLVQHPKSELPEAVQERKERIGKLEQKMEGIQLQMDNHLKWGQEHVGMQVGGWTNNPEKLPDQLRERLTFSQSQLDRTNVQLTQASLYRDLLEGTGIMQDPEVKKTYEPTLRANDEVRALENELDAIKRKPTSKLFGYTEKKKQEEIVSKESELGLKKEEARRNSEAYDEAARKYSERNAKFRETFGGLGKKGGYQVTKSELEASVQELNARISGQQETLRNATYFAETQRALMTEMEEQSQQIALLKGEKSKGE